MLTSKFRVFETPICCSEKTVISIVKCAYVLHNYIRKTEGIMYTPRDDSTKDKNTQIPNVNFEINNHANLTTAKGMSDYLSDYFLKPGVAIPPQWSKILRRTDCVILKL